MATLMQKAGFREKPVANTAYRWNATDYATQSSAQQKEDFIADIIESYLAYFPLDERGNSCIRMKRLEVEAVKH